MGPLGIVEISNFVKKALLEGFRASTTYRICPNKSSAAYKKIRVLMFQLNAIFAQKSLKRETFGGEVVIY